MTAWVVPPTFSHGDKPTAANLNKWSTGLTHLNEIAPAYARNPAARKMTTGERMFFFHRRRWLHYKSSGQIIDPAGLEETISLPNTSDDWVNVYDLEQVGWLAYGAGYWVQGVDFCQERNDP